MKDCVLIVDDHTIMRDGIRAILRHSGQYEVAEAADGTEAVRICKEQHPALVILELRLPGLSGIDTTTEILRHCPGTKIVILSMYNDERRVANALRAGARGFVLKTASENDLLSALRIIAQGGTYLSPAISSGFLASLQRGDFGRSEGTTSLEKLPREKQVLTLVAEGNSSKEIAVLLNLKMHTVQGYRKSLMKKLAVRNVAALTQIAMSSGLRS
jgi:DNA-binding NarL/FixJ family response regulator